MAFAPSLGDWIRAAGGLAYLAFGLYVLLHRPRTPRSRALGAMLAAAGPSLIVSNLIYSSTDVGVLVAGFFVSVLFEAAFLAVLVAFLLREARPGIALRVFAVAYAIAAVLVIPPADFAAAGGLDERDPRVALVAYLAAATTVVPTLGFAALLLVLASAARRSTTPREFAATATVASGLAVWPITYAAMLPPAELFPSAGAYAREGILTAILVAPFLVALVAWSRAGKPEDARPRRALVATLVGVPVGFLALVPFARPGVPGNVPWAILDSTFGIARFIGLAILAYGVFSLDWLGWGRSEKQDRRAFLATGALAALFIVAQVAENLIDERYSLVLGGVIAGAFLVAARPIERAIERVTLGPRPEASALAATTPPAQEERYRNAVRLALRDRVVTRDEEHHLFALAQGLGLTPERAHRILVEVEQEAR